MVSRGSTMYYRPRSCRKRLLATSAWPVSTRISSTTAGRLCRPEAIPNHSLEAIPAEPVKWENLWNDGYSRGRCITAFDSLPRVQVHCRLTRLLSDHLRNKPAMTHHRVLLEAQQARTTLPCKQLRLRQLGLRAIRGHVLAEDHFHPLRMPGPHRVASWLRRAEAQQMHVGNARLVEPGSELALGKTRLARLRHRAHVDQQFDPRRAQFRQYLVDSATLVTDGEQLGHHILGRIGSTPPGGPIPIACRHFWVAWRVAQLSVASAVPCCV